MLLNPQCFYLPDFPIHFSKGYIRFDRISRKITQKLFCAYTFFEMCNLQSKLNEPFLQSTGSDAHPTDYLMFFSPCKAESPDMVKEIFNKGFSCQANRFFMHRNNN